MYCSTANLADLLVPAKALINKKRFNRLVGCGCIVIDISRENNQ